MKLKLFFIFIHISIIASNCFSQQNYFQITTKSQSEYLKFPVLINKDSNLKVEKINNFLQLLKLQLIIKNQKDIFNKIIPNKQDVNGVTEMYYQIHTNNNRYLSLSFNESGSYASVQHWKDFYNFNSKNGNLIHLQDIFSSNCFLNFKALSLKRRIAQLNKEYNKLNKDEKIEYDQIPTNNIKSDNLNDFYIKDSFIYIDDYNIQSKNQKVFDLNLVTKYKLNEFKTYLSNYGKALFGLANDSFLNFQTNLYPQLYKGFVRDSISIMMILDKYNDTFITGYYVYEKFGIGIDLYGSLKKNLLRLTEQDKKYNPIAFIDATYTNAIFTGFWQDIDRKKKYKFFIRRY